MRALLLFGVISAMTALSAGCAAPGRELKAPCGPIASYVEHECGELKSVNAALDGVVQDQP